MISTVHILTGASVGLAAASVFNEPFLTLPFAFIFGVVSHHFLDAIPHTDSGSFSPPGARQKMEKKEMIFSWSDNLVGAALVLLVFFVREPSWPMLAGAVGGNFPDVLHHPNWWRDKTRALFKGAYFKFHRKFHFTARGKLIIVGVLTNIIFIAGPLWHLLSR